MLKSIIQRPFQPDPSLLLHENIPLPLHGLAPRVVLGDSWWREERQKAYKSTDYHCLGCGVHKSKAKGKCLWLEGHEAYDVDYAKGTMTYYKTWPLCHYCHNFIHDGRLAWLLKTKKIPQSKYVAVMQHGEEVLARVGLVRPSREERLQEVLSKLTVEWGDWRLVVFGEEYKPLYPTYEDYQIAMGG